MLKCVNQLIHFDGINFIYRGQIIHKMKDEEVLAKIEPKSHKARVFEIKDQIIKNTCGVV